MNRVSVFILFMLLIGCARTPDLGSEKWHVIRCQELLQALNEGDITRAEYLKLKTETDQMRLQKETGGCVYAN